MTALTEMNCGICFDSVPCFSLSNCGCGFCPTCFGTYTKTTLESSFGLGLAILCPSCRDCVPIHEWHPHASAEQIEKADLSRQVRRHCPNAACQRAVFVSRPLPANPQESHRRCQTLLHGMVAVSSLEACRGFADVCKEFVRSTDLTREAALTFYNEYKTLLGNDPALVCRFFPELSALMPSHGKRVMLQLIHARSFPVFNCECGERLCMLCGERAHGGASCVENLMTLAGTGDADEAATFSMKANCAKQCPFCGVLIERSEGCNHMRCRYCTTEFCYGCSHLYTECAC
eukprot:gnl/Hemi2/10456_TR3614_c0_g1_i1.p1 gnl/Hemi2/10456_TR3614_c0_g1~~gnl/Hemi2/10456_TR3614_c0_g1_i1.p1  ORF type:complete len:289 (+),score=107.78 gnl/Hemi2/10456_TR3614_c0_g1_i1:197-1063(+)